MDWTDEDGLPGAVRRVGAAVRGHIAAAAGNADAALRALAEGPLAACEADAWNLDAAKALRARLEDTALDALGAVRRRILAIDLGIALVAAEQHPAMARAAAA